MRTLYCLFLTAALQGQVLELSTLDLKNVNAEATTYRGSKALKLTEKPGGTGDSLAILKGVSFRDGSIELEVAGAPASGAGEGARGFIGVAFRVQLGASHFECIYLRPTNGRADDQLRRNHATQYISFPDWPWEKLRKETPGVYESYTDLQPGEWTKVRIVVSGVNASLFVGGAAQPCLLIHDLKLGAVEGGVALWIGPGTEGYFRNLKVQ
jgi:hypothetical protein